MRSRDRRLARLAAHSVDAAAEAEQRCAAAQARAAIVDTVRLSLTALGIDPATVSALRRIDKTTDEPAPATPAPQPEDDSPLGAEVERLARRYLDRPAIDFGAASLVEVLAWCIARHNDTPETGEETAGSPTRKREPQI
jgi:hypothetical protein